MKLLAAACALFAAGAPAAQETTQETVKQWQDLAQTDLDAVLAALSKAEQTR